MAKLEEQVWSTLFALSVGVLMLTILLIRSDPMPLWVLVVYPSVGGLLGLAASRTSPTAEQMAWIESGVIAAAAIIVLACLINMLLMDMMLRQFHSEDMLGGGPMQQATFFVALTAVALFWWALQRRLSRFRLAGAERNRASESEGIPAR